MILRVAGHGSSTDSSQYIVQKRVSKVLAITAKQHFRVALDLGCGNGGYSRELTKIADLVVGIDPYFQHLTPFWEESQPNRGIRYLAGCAEDIPVKTGAIDFVFCNEVIEHVADVESTVLEIYRILTDGGVAALYSPNRFYPFDQHGFYFGKTFLGNKFPFVTWIPRRFSSLVFDFPARNFTYFSLRKVLLQAGFRILGHDFLAPPVDNFSKSHPLLGRVIRSVYGFVERVPVLRWLSMSVLVVAGR